MQVVSVLSLVAVCYVPVIALLGAISALNRRSSGADRSDPRADYPWDGGDPETDDNHCGTVLDGETPEPTGDGGAGPTPENPVSCPRCETVNDSRFAYCQQCVRPISSGPLAAD